MSRISCLNRLFVGRLGLLPLPLGEGWREGLTSIDSSRPPHPDSLPTRTRVYPSSALFKVAEVGFIRLRLGRGSAPRLAHRRVPQQTPSRVRRSAQEEP